VKYAVFLEAAAAEAAALVALWLAVDDLKNVLTLECSELLEGADFLQLVDIAQHQLGLARVIALARVDLVRINVVIRQVIRIDDFHNLH
jgi:hypothetical protein